jgi:hypothetical protein
VWRLRGVAWTQVCGFERKYGGAGCGRTCSVPPPTSGQCGHAIETTSKIMQRMGNLLEWRVGIVVVSKRVRVLRVEPWEPRSCWYRITEKAQHTSAPHHTSSIITPQHTTTYHTTPHRNNKQHAKPRIQRTACVVGVGAVQRVGGICTCGGVRRVRHNAPTSSLEVYVNSNSIDAEIE